jgi:parvulin-like peptidyl-prolyl isomerase
VREFETQYGDAVQVRLIAVHDPEKAKKLRAQAAANPQDFGNLAKTYSEDAASASVKGVIHPIRRHGSYKEIEDAVFNMADGQVSPVIHAGGQYVIVQREKLIEGRHIGLDRVASQLEELLRDRKMRGIAQDVFHRLQEEAHQKKAIQDVWNDPAKRARMPGVAAMVYDTQITLRELAEECIARHGQEVLDGVISRKILEQACQKQNITVTAAEIEREIAHEALTSVKSRPDGAPDVDAWLALVTKKHGMSLDVYRNDVVWPAVALKKLAGSKIEVSDEDIRKGFEANYGPRVRCLAIVLNNQRRAQQVFELARKHNTSEAFGDLAAQYSIEPSSQALRGEVPPIQKYGGQPDLEKEAFALRPGELSGIIQVGDKFILMRCEGYTQPVSVEFAKVRDEIYHDLYEKKLHLAMADCFDKLQSTAIVDNYLAGTSHSPKGSGGTPPAAHVPTLRQVPAG